MSPGGFSGVKPRSHQVQEPCAALPCPWRWAARGLSLQRITPHSDGFSPQLPAVVVSLERAGTGLNHRSVQASTQGLGARPWWLTPSLGLEEGRPRLIHGRGLETCKACNWVRLGLWNLSPVTSSRGLLTVPCIKWGSCYLTLLSLKQGLHGQLGKAAAFWTGSWVEPRHVGVNTCTSSDSHFRLSKALPQEEGRERGENQAQRAGLK